jgi:uncharacterized HAD superfamily protein
MIAFDFDDVIFDLSQLLQERILAEYGVDVSNQTDNYYVKVPGISEKELSNFVQSIIIRYHYQGKPIEHSIQALKDIYNKLDIPIVIVTARGHNTKKQTEIWLKRYLKDIPFVVYYCANIPKSEVLKRNNIKYLVDDKIENVEEASKYCLSCFLFTRSYNEKYKPKGNIIRVHDLRDIYDFLENLQ